MHWAKGLKVRVEAQSFPSHTPQKKSRGRENENRDPISQNDVT